jgi:hypothetical protein
VKILYNEITQRFPEIHNQINEWDEELPYLLMNYLDFWLKSFQKITPEILERIVDFTKWCKAQPRGKSASNDIYTMLSVSFYEKLFDSEVTRPILPKLIPREEFIATADYFKQWVGVEDYEKALKEYK